MKEKKERKVSLYKVVMINVIDHIFNIYDYITFNLWINFINGKQLGKYVLVTSSEK